MAQAGRRELGGLQGSNLCALIAGAVLLWSCGEPELLPEHRIAGADPARGRAVVAKIGCGACHVIPGVPGAHGTVGPSLEGFARRNLVGGVAPNRPAVLTQWVRAAPDLAPNTAMPHLPLTEREARDVAAYLYTLR